MSPFAAREDVFERLSQLTTAPIVWPNRERSTVLPRVEVQDTAQVNVTRTLQGATDHTAELALTIVDRAGTGTRNIRTVFEEIEALFPVAARIGAAIIERKPNLRPMIQDDDRARYPVILRYRAFF